MPPAPTNVATLIAVRDRSSMPLEVVGRASASPARRRSVSRWPPPPGSCRSFTGAIDDPFAGHLGGDALQDLARGAAVDQHVELRLAEEVDEPGRDDEVASRRLSSPPARRRATPMAVIRSPTMPMSPRNHGAPVPSTIRPLAMTRRSAPARACGACLEQPPAASARHDHRCERCRLEGRKRRMDARCEQKGRASRFDAHPP